MMKEIYINRLVKTYVQIFECDEMSAILNLRANYTSAELKEILKDLQSHPEISGFEVYMLFKEHNPNLRVTGGRSTLLFWVIAGIAGSFKVLDSGKWWYLIPLWFLVFLVAKLNDFILRRWS